MGIVEMQDRTEVCSRILQVVMMLIEDELFSKTSAAGMLVEILQEYEYLPKIPLELTEPKKEGAQ